MTEPDLHKQPYQRPPLLRGTDPQRMNWLWRLICEASGLETATVVEALHAAGVGVNAQRVNSWSVSDQDAGFFPMSIAEVERNLRALVALRKAEQEVSQALDEAAHPPAAGHEGTT